MSWKPLAGKKVAVLTETEFIPEEMDYYRIGFGVLGADVEFLSLLWGEPSRTLIADVTDPVNPVTRLRTMTENIGLEKWFDRRTGWTANRPAVY